MPTTIDKGTQASIQSQARARIHIYDKKKDLLPTLNTLHQSVIEQVAAGKYEALATGKLPRVGSQIDMQIGDSQTWASDLLSTALWNSGTKANFDVLRITLLEGWRPEELEFDTTGKAFEVFFANEDAQDAKRNENKPPVVDKVKFSDKRPAPGDSISATIHGSDPENMDQTGSGSGMDTVLVCRDRRWEHP